MTHVPPFPSLGCCIYCEARDRSLGKEHIVPRAFWGTLVINAASCPACACITSKLETKCAESMVSLARTHLGIRGRREKRPRSRLPMWIGDTRYSVPIGEHTGPVILAHFPPPRLLLPTNSSEPHTASLLVFVIQPATAAARRRWLYAIRQPGGVRLMAPGHAFNKIYFARVLAKIAHSYAVAKLGSASLGSTYPGNDSFIPTLPNFILGKKADDIFDYVGSMPEKHKHSIYRHHLSIRFIEQETRVLLLVDIHLFGDMGGPVHTVIAGYKSLA